MPQPSTPSKPPVRAVVVVAALATALSAGWYYTTADLPLPSATAADAADAAAPAPDAPAVPTALVVSRAVAPESTFIGRVEAAERVELRPRVAGHVEQVLFKEGQFVKAGQALFTIDARSFEAMVANAQAQLTLAQAQEKRAAGEARRAQELLALDAIAAEEAERRAAALAETQAQVAAAEARLKAARIERDFATLRAPIDGRIGRALVTVGNYVGVGMAQSPLAVLVSSQALQVHFDVADPGVQSHLARQRQPEKLKVTLEGGPDGKAGGAAALDFADNEIEPGTGTLRLRARVTDPQAGLLPGSFVRVRLTHPEAGHTLLVPDEAIGTDQGRHHVLVVDEASTLQYRAVQIGERQDGARVVTQGLKAGERVVTSGLMRVKPGMKVRPVDSAASAG